MTAKLIQQYICFDSVMKRVYAYLHATTDIQNIQFLYNLSKEENISYKLDNAIYKQTNKQKTNVAVDINTKLFRMAFLFHCCTHTKITRNET